MIIEQIYTNCLAHAAYFLESNGEVAIFDPLRETLPYIEKAKLHNAKIKYVFETHFHADFVSGHLDLAAQCGAKIVYGPTAKPGFEAIVAEDGQIFELGQCKIKAIHTPGHTLESTVYLIIDENGKETGLISGDTLFIGDVGRPDLDQHVIADLTQDKLAGMLYHSLRDKIMTLNDDIIIYPNHGAGSACGKNMSKETTDTLGNQKRVNYALNPELTEEEFKKQLLEGLTAPPGYFPSNVLMNIKGYSSFDDVLKNSMKPLSIEEFEHLIEFEKLMILDTRKADVFAQGFIPSSINIGLDGNFAQWVGEVIKNVNQKMVLITDEGKELEAITRLSRIGFDSVQGFLKGGFQSWGNSGLPIDTIERIEANELENLYDENPLIFDVRKKSEFDSKHIVDSENTPLNQLHQHFAQFPKATPFILICAGGYRSMIAASIVKQNGWHHFKDVRGGFAAVEKTSIPCTKFICPTTLL